MPSCAKHASSNAGQSTYAWNVSIIIFLPWNFTYLISSLFISIELNEREAYQRLSLLMVSTHSKARSQHAVLFKHCVHMGSFTSRRIVNNEELQEGAYG